MKRFSVIALLAALIGLAGCGLSPSLRNQIAAEHRHLESAQQEFASSRESLRRDLAANTDLFANTSEPAQWNAQIDNAGRQFQQAAEADRELAELARRNHRDQEHRAKELLLRAELLRTNGLREAQTAVAAAQKWVDFKNDLPAHLTALEHEYKAVHDTDLAPLSKKVEQAGQDWPAKKDVLAANYSTLQDISKKADAVWNETAKARAEAAASRATGSEIASLIEASSTLSADDKALETKSAELRDLSNQLYDSWDKILVDLDRADDGYRERIKTVRTHISDASSHESETSSSEQWVAVSEPAFHAVENDLGMAIAHKDAGLFDSEATTKPQPAGFAYIAPESAGHNQYGYWTHDNGHSVWTWLPQYLILRELLWNHHYRPVVLDEYRGYRVAQSAGRTYYGQGVETSAPKYGTQGSFTKTTYASSRYVQSGGFKGSGYASHRFNSPSSDSRRGPAFNDRGSAGKRFGQAKPGRGFGRSPGRGFGRGLGRGFGRR